MGHLLIKSSVPSYFSSGMFKYFVFVDIDLGSNEKKQKYLVARYCALHTDSLNF